MKERLVDKFYLGLTLFISLLLTADLYLTPGHAAYMDGLAHLTTITQFYQAMKEGFWRVTWAEGFANYGMPFPLYIHQTVGYLGGWLSLVFSGDVVFVYKLMFTLGAAVSSLVFYRFLRLYFTPLSSFAGVFLMNLAPYRILNLYIREALPEFLASVMFPLVLLSTYRFVKRKDKWSPVILTLTYALIALSHPMMLVVGSLLFAGYFLYLVKDEPERIVIGAKYLISLLWGLAIAAYYLIPLKIEIKYFYYGQLSNHLTEGQFLSIANFFDPKWYYFYVRDVANRGHFVKTGLVETLVLMIATLSMIRNLVRSKKSKMTLAQLATIIGVLFILLTTRLAEPIYRNIDLIANIQFPWRMLSAFIYLPAIVVAAYFDQIKNLEIKKALVIIFVIFVAYIRFPQIYSKNNTMHNMERYYFTPVNLHSTVMNTIWSGESVDYPVKEIKGEIIEGDGTLEIIDVKSGYRKYKVRANEQVRLADYTFYFPGWKAYVNGQDTNIEFQDPNYRGVITYMVPEGEHEVILKFEDTKLRKVANIITLGSVALLLAYILRLAILRR